MAVKTKIRNLLHVRSYYSLLTSLVNVDHYLQLAVNSHLSWLSLIDRGTMFYHLGFYLRCQKLKIKPVLGISFVILFGQEPIEAALIAKNFTGIKTLMRLSSDFLTSEIVPPRIAWTALQSFLTDDNNLLVVIPKKRQLTVWFEFKNQMTQTQLTFYLGVNKQNWHQINSFQVETTHHLWFETVCYLLPEHRSTYQMLRAIKDQIPFRDVKNDFTSLDLVSDQVPTYLHDNAEQLVKKINVKWQYASHHKVFVKYSVPYNQTPGRYLAQLARQGLKDKLKTQANAVRYLRRLQYELQVINQCQLDNYFLVVYDYVKFAKSHNILVGPGRGSAAASLVSYALNITDIDPVRFNLIFERFLNSERSVMPDIDVDVQDNKRELIINYLVKKYGSDRVAYINTFQRLKLKMALRDVGRACQVPLTEVNELAKLIGNRTYDEFQLAAQQPHQVESVYWTKYQFLFRHLPLLIGLPRQTGTHAAGVIVSEQPLVQTVPTIGPGVGGVLKTQWDMVDLETVGLIKMDILGLTNLTVIAETLNNVAHEQQKRLILADIPLNDQVTFRLLDAGETTGIFQLESVGMTKLLMNMHPCSLEDIAITSALFRPGPAIRKELYLERRKAHYQFRHPTCSALNAVLQSTLGVIIFQEQVMLIAQRVASFSLNQADMLRRAMAKKDAGAMTQLKSKFWLGARANNWNDGDIDQFWTLIARFSSYGFNRAHALAYSLVGYWMAYLKANFWIFFITALLNSVIGEEVKTHYYLKLVMHRQKIAPPSVNRPALRYVYQQQVLQLPLVLIKQVGRVFVTEIKRDVVARGRYRNVFDLFRRLRSAGLNQQTYEALVYSGALDDFRLDRGVLVNNYDIILNYVELTPASHGQALAGLPPPPILTGPVLTTEQRARTEFKYLGFYLTQHPVCEIRQKMVPTAIQINQLLVNTPDDAVVVGWVNRQKIIRDKHNREMAFIDIEDESASTALIAFAANYQRFRIGFEVGDVVRAKVKRGRLYRGRPSYTILSLVNLKKAHV